MKKLLEYIITSIVKHSRDVKITEKEENGVIIFTIKADPEDLKILIGKNGQTIKAIREIMRVKAISQGKIINIKIEEKN
jgi:predicted RNA-binding protein YlqC (UPF0109 family)